MNSHDKKVIQKIIEHASHVIEYVSNGNNVEEFMNNGMVVEACVFNIMQIGELAHSELSEETKQSNSSIPWKQIYGMRNLIVHGYSDVSMDVVWETAKEDMKVLKQEMEAILNQTS